MTTAPTPRMVPTPPPGNPAPDGSQQEQYQSDDPGVATSRLRGLSGEKQRRRHAPAPPQRPCRYQRLREPHPAHHQDTVGVRPGEPGRDAGLNGERGFGSQRREQGALRGERLEEPAPLPERPARSGSTGGSRVAPASSATGRARTGTAAGRSGPAPSCAAPRAGSHPSRAAVPLQAASTASPARRARCVDKVSRIESRTMNNSDAPASGMRRL